jgi:hypothetical protein
MGMSLILDGSASVTINSGAILGITSGTAVASTSGTSIDFTSIPSWVKRITVMFNGVSTSGTSAIQIQTGSGSITSTGYNSISGFYTNANQTAVSTATSGFVEAVSAAITAAATRTGVITIQNLTSNTWVTSGVYGNAGNTVMCSITGNIALGGTLDRVRITTVNGTDTFDAGSVNILYE